MSTELNDPLIPNLLPNVLAPGRVEETNEWNNKRTIPVTVICPNGKTLKPYSHQAKANSKAILANRWIPFHTMKFFIVVKKI